MADTALKFGPEWLRALSDRPGPSQTSNSTLPSNSGIPAPTTKYKLAEFRYGREEMLALFDETSTLSNHMRQDFPNLTSEKCMLPLALVAMTEEEHRLWSRSINSDVVIRLQSKERGNAVPAATPVPSTTAAAAVAAVDRDRGAGLTLGERGGRDAVRGRGLMTSDRGRGRGGRGFYQRGMPFDEREDTPDVANNLERRDFRKGFDSRSTSAVDEPGREKVGGFERSFGGPRLLDTEDSRARKDAPKLGNESWRGAPAKAGEERGNWRTRSKDEAWTGRSSWRDGRDDEQDMRNGPRRQGNSFTRDWDENDEDTSHRSNLPEWSLDDAGTTVGSFDASGAFREGSPEGDGSKDDGGGEWTTARSSRSNNSHGRNVKVPSGPSERADFDRQSNNRESDESLKMPKEINREQQQQHPQQQQKVDDFRNFDALRNFTRQAADDNDSKTGTNSSGGGRISRENHSQKSNSTRIDVQGKVENKPTLDEDSRFSHLEKEAESMVAQWTAEEDVHDRRSEFFGGHSQPKIDEHSVARQQPKGGVLPVGHEDAFKWLYRDPQDDIQGPFSSPDMLEWFNAGYFTMDLLVRRCCDEKFCQLGDLIKLCDRVPFMPGAGNPPPLRHIQQQHQAPPHQQQMPHNMPPMAHAAMNNSMSSHPPADFQMRQLLLAQQQAQRQVLLQQQQLQMQNQLRQMFAHLKSQPGFSELAAHEQQEILVRQYAQHVEQQKRLQQQPQNIPMESPHVQVEHSVLLQQQHQNTQLAMARGAIPQAAQTQHSIWEINGGGVITASALEEMQRKELDRKELEDNQRKLMEDEQRRRIDAEEANKMREEEERRMIDMQRDMEKRREEENRRLKEEHMRQKEDARRKKEEEERRAAEEKRLREEQHRRQEEMRRLEDIARQQKDEASRRKIEEENERLRQAQKMEMDRQRAQQQLETEKLRQQQQQAELRERFQDRKGWGSPPSQTPTNFTSNMSLAEIQKLQEEKEQDELRKQSQLQQQQLQALFHAQQMQQQHSQSKQQQASWASGASRGTPIKTLSEIQKEEADKLAKQKKIEEDIREQFAPKTMNNVGIWSNAASQLNWKPSPSNPSPGVWNTVPETSNGSERSQQQSGKQSSSGAAGGFWEQDEAPVRAPGNKASSALNNSNKPSSNSANNSSKAANSKAKRHEEAVLGLFENQRRQKSDEFTAWCEEALSKFQSAIDVPTFVTFLKDIESPFDVNDYVRSYLGENKDSRDFAKQFLEKRSFYRNKSKQQQSSEELMWGPAPAITPSVNKSSVPGASSASGLANNSADGNSGDAAAKAAKAAKKKKGKRVDNSILGFTVQADPDRINAGEIEHLE